jgi:hypothetical protein
MAKFGFDVAEVDVNAIQVPGNYDPIPEGDYVLKALESEEKDTASGGQMIKVKFEVVGGEHNGRWVWQNFNTVNKSDAAQRIGRQQLVAWATACGKADCDDTDKLIDKKFNATVAVEPAKGQYAASNKIKAFLFARDDKPAAAKAPGAKPAAAKTPAAAPAAAKSANPWD